MDRLDAMKTLVAAIDAGSLSAASRNLGTPLATVSRKVSDLEAELGAQLVIRTSRKLVVTETGAAYVQACRQILEDVDDAERAAAGEYRIPRGHLTIAASVMFGQRYVEPIVLAFLKAYPDIRVRLVLADQNVELVESHVDVAVRIGNLPDSAMIATRLGAVRWVVCASPDYLRQRGVPELPSDLAGHDCIMFEGFRANGAWSSDDWQFGKGDDATALPINPRLRVNTAESAISAVIAGNGVARLLSYQIAPALAAGDVAVILAAHEQADVPVHLLHIGQAIMPLKLRAFLDFATPRLRNALEALGH